MLNPGQSHDISQKQKFYLKTNSLPLNLQLWQVKVVLMQKSFNSEPKIQIPSHLENLAN